MNAPLEELKARFLNVYGETITREGADDLLQWLTESDFFVAPASTRFHGSHEGGLLQHSLNVYDCLKRNVEQAGLQDTYPLETIAVSALLHDVCKVNFYKKGYRNAKDEETGQWYKKEVYEITRPKSHGDNGSVSSEWWMTSPKQAKRQSLLYANTRWTTLTSLS